MTLKIIKIIAGVLVHGREFRPYTIEDMRQECIMHILEKAMCRYDESKPLENFIRTCTKNWYINFRRDKFARPGMKDDAFLKKRSLANPINIDLLTEDFTHLEVEHDLTEQIDADQVWAIIDEHLPVKLRHDYLRLKSGSVLVSYRRHAVMEAINEIMIEYGLIANDEEEF